MILLSQYYHFLSLTKEVLLSSGGLVCSREPEIEKFFKTEAIDYASEYMGSSYCLIDKDNGHMVAAFCLACASVETDEMPKSMRNKLNRSIPHIKQRETYPAILLAQLAIADEYSHLHLGDRVMDLIKMHAIALNKQLAARYIIVDAVNSPKVIDFYARNNFKMVFASEEEEKHFDGKSDEEQLNTRFMLTDLKDVRI